MRKVLWLSEAGRLGYPQRSCGSRPWPLGTPSPWRPPSAQPAAFCEELDRESLVIGNHPRVHAYLFAARRRRGGPAMVNVAHEQDSASRPFARYAYRRSGALLVVGTNAARAYGEKLPGLPVTEINNFLPVDYFTGARAGIDRAPRFDGRVGVLARLIPEKGVLELIDELADDTARTEWKELLLGGPAQDPAYVKALEERITHHGLEERITLVGEIEDVPAFLADVDALVMPSTGPEAQGRVIIEGARPRRPGNRARAHLLAGLRGVAGHALRQARGSGRSTPAASHRAGPGAAN